MTTIPEQNQSTSAGVPKGSRRSASPQVSPERVNDFVKEILGDDVHATRVLSFKGSGISDAIGFALRHEARVIALVPCCQAEVARLLDDHARHPLHPLVADLAI